MRFFRRWLIKIIETVCSGAIGHGILSWLADRNIHPDQWVASLLAQAGNVHIATAAWWIIAGTFGVLCTIGIEYFKPSIGHLFSRIWYREKATTRHSGLSLAFAEEITGCRVETHFN